MDLGHAAQLVLTPPRQPVRCRVNDLRPISARTGHLDHRRHRSDSRALSGGCLSPDCRRHLGVGALYAPCRLPSRNRACCSLHRRAAQIRNATWRGCAEPLAGASAGHDRKSRLGIRRAEACLVLPVLRVRLGRTGADGQAGARRRHSVPGGAEGAIRDGARPLQRQSGAANDTDR